MVAGRCHLSFLTRLDGHLRYQDLPTPAKGKHPQHVSYTWSDKPCQKKCDEQREGDSCHTCNRLKIKCLGWGPKRPDWMRVSSPAVIGQHLLTGCLTQDKQAVEAYKADIKAQLTRAGLIRGQPRSSILQAATTSSGVFTTHQYQGPPSSAPQIDPGPAPSLIFSDSSQGQSSTENSTMLTQYGRESIGNV